MVHNDCLAGNPLGADTIVLPGGGVFTLTTSFGTYYSSPTGLPKITSEITIEGNGSTIRRDPADPDRFRLLAVNGSGNLTLKNVTLSGGHALNANGGAVVNEGKLIISNSTINGNTAAGSGSGGGVYNYDDPLMISNSIISGNTARVHGGGVDTNYGDVTISPEIGRSPGCFS